MARAYRSGPDPKGPRGQREKSIRIYSFVGGWRPTPKLEVADKVQCPECVVRWLCEILQATWLSRSATCFDCSMRHFHCSGCCWNREQPLHELCVTAGPFCNMSRRICVIGEALHVFSPASIHLWCERRTLANFQGRWPGEYIYVMLSKRRSNVRSRAALDRHCRL
jgi:hypothetical protein